jgi:hypothetical protein
MTPQNRSGGTLDFRSLQIVWVALMFGLATYTIVAYCVLAFGMIETPMLPTSVLRIAGAVAGAIMLGGLFARRTMVQAIDPSASPAERLRDYARATIMGLGLVDLGGFLMVTLGIVSAAPMAPLVVGSAGVGALALARPKREHIGLDR